MQQYNNFNLNDLEEFCKKLLDDPKHRQFKVGTGKGGRINFEKVLMSKYNFTQEEIDAKVKWVEENLEDGYYTLPL
jgi:hypothetical protein